MSFFLTIAIVMDSSGVTGDSCSTKTEDHMAYVYWEHNMRIYIYIHTHLSKINHRKHIGKLKTSSSKSPSSLIISIISSIRTRIEDLCLQRFCPSQWSVSCRPTESWHGHLWLPDVVPGLRLQPELPSAQYLSTFNEPKPNLHACEPLGGFSNFKASNSPPVFLWCPSLKG